MSLGLLKKLQQKTHLIRVEEESLEFSLGTPELEVLDTVIKEDKEGYYLEVIRRNGVNPFENAKIDCYEAYIKAGKEFWQFVDKVAEDAQLTRMEVLYRIPEDLSQFLEQIEEEVETIKEQEQDNIKKVTNKLKQVGTIKQAVKEQQKEIAIALGQETIDKLRELGTEYEQLKEDYYFALSELRTGLKVETIKNLHLNFQRAITGYIRNELEGWPKPVKPEEAGKEVTAK